jgi:hypothetical protein
MTGRFTLELLKRLLVLAVGFSGTALYAQPASGTVTVRGLMGSATYSTAGSAAMPLRPDSTIPIGSVVKTGTGAAVDLSLSHNAGVVRLLQNATLSIDHFNASGPTTGAPVDIQLNLSGGAMLGFDQKLSATSKYRVKVPQGIADVTGSKYRLDAQGYLVLLEGTALFAFVSAGGEPTPFPMTAPPAVYFSPLEGGVRPAPSELEREVTLQAKGKLRGP